LTSAKNEALQDLRKAAVSPLGETGANNNQDLDESMID
jgi:hypothetical protein